MAHRLLDAELYPTQGAIRDAALAAMRQDGFTVAADRWPTLYSSQVSEAVRPLFITVVYSLQLACSVPFFVTVCGSRLMTKRALIVSFCVCLGTVAAVHMTTVLLLAAFFRADVTCLSCRWRSCVTSV